MTEQQPQAEAERWAGAMGDRWLAHIDQFESMISVVGDAGIAHAGFGPGEAVIDVGCGGGLTSLAIGRIVGPSGSVTGVDVSPALVDAASRRASSAGAGNVRFVAADAASADFGSQRFDRLFSRFGVMFFEEPYGAFAHLHAKLRPGGRLDFVCWGPPDQNPWMTELREVIVRYVPAPDGPPPAPRAPGPFAFADPGYVREILGHAGFRRVEAQPWRGELLMGGAGSDPIAAVRFVTEALPFGEALEGLEPGERADAHADLEAMFARRHGPDGVKVPSMAWFVSARA